MRFRLLMATTAIIAMIKPIIANSNMHSSVYACQFCVTPLFYQR